MPYDDDPIVDDSASRSRDSVEFVKGVLAPRNGFLPREETPDYGVDLDVELIRDSRACGFKIAVQIKSVQRRTVVTTGEATFVSYAMHTGRLGYLARRTPGPALLVIYEATSRSGWYGFVEDIVAELARRGDDWLSQQTVTAHIPIEQQLSDESVSAIWNRCDQRRANYSKLLSEHGPAYGIPTLSFQPGSQTGAVEALEEHGLALFSDRDIRLLLSMLDAVPWGDLRRNAKLLLIAGLANAEAGKLNLAEYFLSLVEGRLQSLNSDRVLMWSVYRASVDFRLGRTNILAYRSSLTQLLSTQGLSDYNRIGIRIRLLACQLANLREQRETVMQDLDALEAAIDAAKLSDSQKHLLRVHAASIGEAVALDLMHHWYVATRIMSAFGRPLALDIRASMARGVILAHQHAQTMLFEAQKWALANQDDYVAAHAAYRMAYYVLATSVFATAVAEPSVASASTDGSQVLTALLRDVVLAHNSFATRGLTEDALNSLRIGLDLCVHHERRYGRPLDARIAAEFEERLNAILATGEFGAPKSLVPEPAPPSGQSPDAILENASSEELDMVADQYAEVLGLSPDRQRRFREYLENRKRIREMLDDRNAELLQNLAHTRSPNTLYASDLKYVLRCAKCGYQTPGTSDMRTLVGQWRIGHPHRCL